jgi:hypothetical protein
MVIQLHFIDLTLSPFRDTLAANESCFSLGQSSGLNPYHYTALPCIPMSDRSAWSVTGPSRFRNPGLQFARHGESWGRDTNGG